MKIKVDFKIFLLIICFLILGKIKVFSILFFFILIHELSHIIAGLFLGLNLKKISLTISGFSIEFKERKSEGLRLKSLKRFKDKMIIDLAGPISNFVFIFIGILIKNENVLYANLILFLVNIFPIIPLDGGRILKNILLKRYNFRTASNVMIEITKYNLIILSLFSSLAVIYLENIFIGIFVIYLWVLYVKEVHNVNMINEMYGVIHNELNRKT